MNLHRTTRSASLDSRKVLTAVLASVLVFTGLMALNSAPAEAKYKQPSCGKFKKAIKKAKGKNQKLRAKSNLKSCKDNRKVYNKVKNGRYVGVREDGQPIDITLCANGKAADDVGSEFEQVYRKGWKIEGAKVKGKYFEGGFEASLGANANRAGSLKLDKSGWQVGIYSLGESYEFGPAERTNAAKLCKQL